MSISTYWLMMLVGAIVMLVLMQRRKERFGLTTTNAVIFTVCLMFCGLLGTKLLYILEHLDEVRTHGLTLGGLSFYGAVFLVPILMPLLHRVFSMERKKVNDASYLCGLGILGSLRFGCFLSGCCGGWEATIGGFSFRWPTQAVESVGDFALLYVLYRWEKQGRFVGQMYPLFMISYSVLRFFVEFFRDTPKDLLLMSRGQWYALLSILIGVIWFAHSDRKNKKI